MPCFFHFVYAFTSQLSGSFCWFASCLTSYLRSGPHVNTVVTPLCHNLVVICTDVTLYVNVCKTTAGVRRGEFTCVRWQVTLCDPILQVTPQSSEMTCHEELYV